MSVEKFTSPDRFEHDASNYERPNQRYCCGRGSLWQKPCMNGPNPDGSCGGTTECVPFRSGDRWECRRPRSAGGSCADGPLPDGTCCMKRAPCSPQPKMRTIRERLSWAAAVVVLALVAALTATDISDALGLSMVEPGPLTRAHDGFTSNSGCVACHSGHSAENGSFLSTLVDSANPSEQCTSCHVFGGPAKTAHNKPHSAVAGKGLSADVGCVACHTEHKGPDANIIHATNKQCATCHEDKFDNFQDHVAFRPDFPHRARTAIRFDHASHLGQHFQDARYAKKAPGTCTDCHSVTKNDAAVLPGDFEQTCAACHDKQIPNRELVLLRLPETLDAVADPEAIDELCGIEHEIDLDDFESVSVEEMTPLMAHWLKSATDEPESYSQGVSDLVTAMLEEGQGPLSELMSERGVDAPEILLAGLSPELVKRLACAWGGNLEYEAPAEHEGAGWYGEGLELKYRPAGHADPIAQAWLDYVVSTKKHIQDWEFEGPVVEENPCAVESPVTFSGDKVAYKSVAVSSYMNSELENMATLMDECPDLTLEIAGHTDNVGSPSYNLELSIRRAEAVRARLLEFGVESTRVIAEGYGQTEPVASNDSDAGKANNRRIELRFGNLPEVEESDFDVDEALELAIERAEGLQESLLSSKEGPGACTKCHAVAREGEDLKVVWQSQLDESARGGGVYFSHGPHLRLVRAEQTAMDSQSSGCAVCHRQDSTVDYSAAFEQGDMTSYKSNFKGISKETCATCHNPKRVEADCTVCHRYHESPGFSMEMADHMH